MSNTITEKKNTAWVIVAVAVILIIGAVILFKSPAAPATETKNVPIATPAPKKTATIFYSSEGFFPSSTIVKKGDTVVFENGSDKPFWPASAPHPAHTGYPEKGSCGGSAFDACSAAESGGTWTFSPNKAGEWKYHNHLNPNLKGVLIVE